MFTLATMALAVLTVLATLAAPLLVNLYAHALTGPERHLTVIFAFFFIPQIFFYGVSSLAGGVLNARGRFAAPMWTPVINNIVVILVLLLFIATGGIGVAPGNISTAQIQLLGFGTTLGIIAQTAAMIPALHRAGFRWRPRFDFRRAEVTEIRRMAAPLLGYVLTTQVSFLVVQNVANAASTHPGRQLRLVLHLQLRLAAVPDAVRHHRHLGDHRAAAPDERARRRAPPAAGPQRLLHRGPAVLGDRGASRPAAHRARRAAG